MVDSLTHNAIHWQMMLLRLVEFFSLVPLTSLSLVKCHMRHLGFIV